MSVCGRARVCVCERESKRENERGKGKEGVREKKFSRE